MHADGKSTLTSVSKCNSGKVNYSTNLVEIGFYYMKTYANREVKEESLLNVTKVIILGKTRELKGKLPKIILKQKISEEMKERNLTKEK